MNSRSANKSLQAARDGAFSLSRNRWLAVVIRPASLDVRRLQTHATRQSQAFAGSRSDYGDAFRASVLSEDLLDFFRVVWP
jgi:hypothetical protein